MLCYYLIIVGLLLDWSCIHYWSNRAGISLSLISLFSSIMAISIYDQTFQFFHLIEAILIILGLFLLNKEIKNA